MQIFGRFNFDVLMTVSTFSYFNFQSMNVVAFCTVVKRTNMLVLPIIFITGKLIRALHFCTEERRTSREVMDILEAQVISNFIIAKLACGPINRTRRRTTLVTVDTGVGRFSFAKRYRCPTGEGNIVKGVQLKRFQTAVAGGTVQAIGRRLGDGNTFSSQQRQTCCRVTFATASRYSAIFIPMTEGFFRPGKVTVVNPMQGVHING